MNRGRERRGLVRASDGAAALEFALLAPLVLAVIVATFAFASYFSISNSLSTAVDEAARYALVTPAATDTAIRTRANASLLTATDPAKVTLAITRVTTNPQIVRITLDASYPVTLDFLGLPQASMPVSKRKVVFVPVY